MRFALAVSAACFAYLRCVCLVQFPAGATAVSVSTCSAAAASATSTGTSAATIIDVDGAGAGCDGLTEPFTGTPGTARERSFFAIKPDGVQRGLVGEVMTRFERKGWKLVGLKMLTAPRPLVERHYEEHAGKDFFENLLNYMCSGPVVAMVWEGTNVIAGGRKLLGATNPANADVGTIRGDLCTTPGRNLVHASDGPTSAAREIALWFSEEETVNWSRSVDPWVSRDL
eukprot:jgi/Undpi1/13458/HiC_scaffold_8.g03117.m1